MLPITSVEGLREQGFITLDQSSDPTNTSVLSQEWLNAEDLNFEIGG